MKLQTYKKILLSITLYKNELERLSLVSPQCSLLLTSPANIRIGCNLQTLYLIWSISSSLTVVKI